MSSPAVGASRAPSWLAIPISVWFALFLIVPLAIVVTYSFAAKGTYGGIVFDWSLDNYWRSFSSIYLRIFVNSLRLALMTTVSCLLIGYPMAYVMAVARPAVRNFMLVLVVVPFWTNFVVRAYAIKVLLTPQGWTNSEFAVWLGMVTNYLPFMVLPLFVSLEKFDFRLIEAARDLGASSWSVVTRILLPLTKAGIVTGTLFVFTPALGEFVIPDLLGGARTMLIGNLVTEQFLKTRDWPFGSALSLLLIVMVLISLALYLRTERVQRGEASARK